MRWSWMMPSRSGRTKSMCAGARPTIFNASSPTARMEFVRVSTAPMVGWRNTTPCSSVAMIMEVVPRSIPMSYCFMDGSPLVKYRRSIASMPLRAWLSRQPQPPLRSGQDRSLQAGVNGRFVGRGLDPSVPAHVAESCSCFSSVGVAASFSKYRSPLYRIFCRTFSTMVCSVRAVPVRTQSFRARVTPVYKRLR